MFLLPFLSASSFVLSDLFFGLHLFTQQMSVDHLLKLGIRDEKLTMPAPIQGQRVSSHLASSETRPVVHRQGRCGRVLGARLGLLPLALLLPMQIYSNQAAVVPVRNNFFQDTSAAPNPASATIEAGSGALKSTASLLGLAISHISTERQPRNVPAFPF